jgi:hypothetical protein
MCLEGVVITLGSITLTVFHPGLVFGNHWRQADFSLKGKTPRKHITQFSNPNIEILDEKRITQEIVPC